MPTTVRVGNRNLTGTVQLNCAAPEDGLRVRLRSSNRNEISTPNSVEIPTGAREGIFRFAVLGDSYPNGATVQIDAGLNGLRAQPQMVQIQPTVAPVAACPDENTVLKLSVPTTVSVGAQNLRGTVRLNCQAPPDGLRVKLINNSRILTTPNTIEIPAEQDSANFPISVSGNLDLSPNGEAVRIGAALGRIRAQQVIRIFPAPQSPPPGDPLPPSDPPGPVLIDPEIRVPISPQIPNPIETEIQRPIDPNPPLSERPNKPDRTQSEQPNIQIPIDPNVLPSEELNIQIPIEREQNSPGSTDSTLE